MQKNNYPKSQDEIYKYKQELLIHHTCYQDVLNAFIYFQRELFFESRQVQSSNPDPDWSPKEIDALITGIKEYGTTQSDLKKILKRFSNSFSPSHRNIQELKDKMNELKDQPQYKKVFRNQSDKPDHNK